MHRPIHYAFKDEENVYVYKNHRLIHVSQDYVYESSLPRQLHISHFHKAFPLIIIQDGEKEYGYHGYDCAEINQKEDEREWAQTLSINFPFLCKDVWSIVAMYS